MECLVAYALSNGVSHKGPLILGSDLGKVIQTESDTEKQQIAAVTVYSITLR